MMKWFGARSGSTRQAGQAGEDAALAYLQRQGLKLVERNFRCKGGEIDLIMQAFHGSERVLVFVEVRQRAGMDFGGAAASVTHTKQRRLILAAQVYLQRFTSTPACRFDVIAIEGAQLNWLQNAFEM